MFPKGVQVDVNKNKFVADLDPSAGPLMVGRDSSVTVRERIIARMIRIDQLMQKSKLEEDDLLEETNALEQVSTNFNKTKSHLTKAISKTKEIVQKFKLDDNVARQLSEINDKRSEAIQLASELSTTLNQNIEEYANIDSVKGLMKEIGGIQDLEGLKSTIDGVAKQLNEDGEEWQKNTLIMWGHKIGNAMRNEELNQISFLQTEKMHQLQSDLQKSPYSVLFKKSADTAGGLGLKESFGLRMRGSSYDLSQITKRQVNTSNAEDLLAGSMSNPLERAQASRALRKNKIVNKLTGKIVDPNSIIDEQLYLDSERAVLLAERARKTRPQAILERGMGGTFGRSMIDLEAMGPLAASYKHTEAGSYTSGDYTKTWSAGDSVLGSPEDYQNIKTDLLTSDSTRSEEQVENDVLGSIVNDMKFAAELEVEALRKNQESVDALTQEITNLPEKFARHNPRSIGLGAEMKDAFFGEGSAWREGFAAVQTESEQLYSTLAVNMPMAMKDGMVNALSLTLSKADDLRDKMKNIGINFLQMMQRAFMESAVSRVMGGIGQIFQLNAEGGMIHGGSGVRDDVPALLTGGEYVIKKSSVEKYGGNFLSKINSGSLSGYENGGAVSSRSRGPKIPQRESYEDESEYGNITRYRQTGVGRPIDSKLSGFARENDPSIKKYFRDQEKQFEEDLRTLEQVKDRKEAEDQARTDRRRAYQGAIIGILGGGLLAKGIDTLAGPMRGWGRKKKWDKSLREDGTAQSYGQTHWRDQQGLTFKQKQVRKQEIEFAGATRGANAALEKANSYNIDMRLSRPASTGGILRPGSDDFYWGSQYGEKRRRRAKGGPIPEDNKVPALLTGGEFVMNREAVDSYGSDFMARLNQGSLPGFAEGGPVGDVSPAGGAGGGEVSITVNISDAGTSENITTSGAESGKEFATKVKSAVLQVIADQKRVGGSLR